MQAPDMSMGLLQEVLVLSAGKGGEEESAAVALASLRQALVGRVQQRQPGHPAEHASAAGELLQAALERVGGGWARFGGSAGGPLAAEATVHAGLACRVNVG